MKYILLICIGTVVLFSCKPCVECKYPTQKGMVGDQLCSSIEADKEAFKAKWDSLAKASGTEVICTQKNY